MALLLMVVLAQAEPRQEETGLGVQVAAAIGAVVVPAGIGTAALVPTRRASFGLALASQGFSDLFALGPSLGLVIFNPLVMLEERRDSQSLWLYLTVGSASAVAGSALGALGAWTGERLPFLEPRGTYLGAWAGAGVGAVTALLVDRLVHWLLGSGLRRAEFQWTRYLLATSLISLGATVGIRLSAGAPP